MSIAEIKREITPEEFSPCPTPSTSSWWTGSLKRNVCWSLLRASATLAHESRRKNRGIFRCRRSAHLGSSTPEARVVDVYRPNGQNSLD